MKRKGRGEWKMRGEKRERGKARRKKGERETGSGSEHVCAPGDAIFGHLPWYGNCVCTSDSAVAINCNIC